MSMEKLTEARTFLEELAESPPWLPYEPTLLPLLFSSTRDSSNASIDDLTSLIERSQKLATRVLSLANSALYALESTVTSLRRAISILGFREVRTLVIMIGAVSAIKGAKLPKGFDAASLWRHQVKTATIAKALAAALAPFMLQRGGNAENSLEMAPDEAYAAALLHDIGKVFLAASRPQIWFDIMGLTKANNVEFHEAEDAYWGMDHALIGAQVLHYWKLPLLLTDPINWHHAPELAPAYKMEAKLLAVADLLAHSGMTSQGALPDEAMVMLPGGLDPIALGTVVHQSLNNEKNFAISGMMD